MKTLLEQEESVLEWSLFKKESEEEKLKKAYDFIVKTFKDASLPGLFKNFEDRVSISSFSEFQKKNKIHFITLDKDKDLHLDLSSIQKLKEYQISLYNTIGKFYRELTTKLFRNKYTNDYKFLPIDTKKKLSLVALSIEEWRAMESATLLEQEEKQVTLEWSLFKKKPQKETVEVKLSEMKSTINKAKALVKAKVNKLPDLKKFVSYNNESYDEDYDYHEIFSIDAWDITSKARDDYEYEHKVEPIYDMVYDLVKKLNEEIKNNPSFKYFDFDTDGDWDDLSVYISPKSNYTVKITE